MTATTPTIDLAKTGYQGLAEYNPGPSAAGPPDDVSVTTVVAAPVSRTTFIMAGQSAETQGWR